MAATRNQFPFFPNLHEPFDPVKAAGTRAPLLARYEQAQCAQLRHEGDVSAVQRRARAPGRSLSHGAVSLRLPDRRRAGRWRLAARRSPDRQGERVQPGAGCIGCRRCASCRGARARPKPTAIWSACARGRRRMAARTCWSSTRMHMDRRPGRDGASCRIARRRRCTASGCRAISCRREGLRLIVHSALNAMPPARSCSSMNFAHWSFGVQSFFTSAQAVAGSSFA